MYARAHTLVLTAAVALAALLPRPAGAHEPGAERTVAAQIKADAVEVLLLYAEPAGPAARLLISRFDINNDGKIAGPEVPLAAPEVVPRLLHGLQFEIEGERPSARAPELKFDVSDKGDVTIAAFVRYEVPALPDDGRRTFHVRLQRHDAVPTNVVLRAGENLRIVETALPRQGDVITKPVQLTLGGQATATVARREPAPTPDGTKDEEN